MILYVQTPAIPRTDVHNVCIKTMIQTLDRLEEFSEIRWFVNLDVITSHTSTHTWQDYKINEECPYGDGTSSEKIVKILGEI